MNSCEMLVAATSRTVVIVEKDEVERLINGLRAFGHSTRADRTADRAVFMLSTHLAAN